MEVSPLNIFNYAAQFASTSQKTETKKTDKTKRKAFESAIEQSKAELKLKEEGFPPEIAGLEVEEAAVYLRDQAEIAADTLRENMLPENFSEFKKKVSVFIKYVEKNNFKVTSEKRFVRDPNTRLKVPMRDRKGREVPPRVQIQIINQSLDELTKYFLYEQKDTFKMLSKIKEISGMLVDLMAS